MLDFCVFVTCTHTQSVYCGGSQSVACGPLKVPETIWRVLQGQNFFHDIMMLFAFFTGLAFTLKEVDKTAGGFTQIKAVAPGGTSYCHHHIPHQCALTIKNPTNASF